MGLRRAWYYAAACVVFAQLVCCAVICAPFRASADSSPTAPAPKVSTGFVAVIDMNMLILPGTQGHLERALDEAHARGARALVVLLDTPGGVLQSAQQMIQIIFRAPIPVIVYVSPSGSGATSAGALITLAAHVAAMAPGTTIGAATPVNGDGKNLDSDMKAKAESLTSAMARTTAERRGRNVEWAEKAVREASALTETEALKSNVVDLVASSLDDLLRQIKGRKVVVNDETVILEDLSALPRETMPISYSNSALNVLSHPSVVAILWLLATAGIAVEIYNPGVVLPGAVGALALIVALGMNQVIPVNQAAVLMLLAGAVLIGAELYTGTLLLGVLGVASIVFGSFYLIDTSDMPGLGVPYWFIAPVALIGALSMLAVSVAAYRVTRKKSVTGFEGMIGLTGEAREHISSSGTIYVNGELWKASTTDGVIDAGCKVQVVGVKPGLVLDVRRCFEPKTFQN